MGETPPLAPDHKRSALATVLLGIGFMAAVDEIIFHQILAWHHFYDGSTPLIGLMSDGFLHAGELIAFVAGFYLLASQRSRFALHSGFAWAGFFLGLGGFQLFDGIIDHKVLRLHQIRYGVDSILPYDIVWNAVAIVLILIGAGLWRRARARAKEQQ